jgi:glycosyltransferase involved in cell wall biosynthesis
VAGTLTHNPGGAARVAAYIAGLHESGVAGRAKAVGYALCAADLVDHCRAAHIDHVHAHSCADVAHVAAMCELLGGPTYSLTLHGDLPVYGVDHRSKMRRAAFVATAARPMQRQVIDQAGVPPERTCTIWMGVETDRFVPSGRPAAPGSLHVVTIARLAECKGHRHALAAVRHAVDRGADVTYSIAGSGPDEAAIRSEVARLGLGARVRMVGSVGEHEVLALLHSADVFVLEAMSCGVPAIVSIIGGTADMITDGVDGHLVSQGDEAAIGERLVRLANAPEERVRLGRAARQRAVAAFDSRHSARALLDAIERWRAAARPQA